MEVRPLGPLEVADGARRSRTGGPPAGWPPCSPRTDGRRSYGRAFVARRDPPGYETFTWTDRIRLAP